MILLWQYPPISNIKKSCQKIANAAKLSFVFSEMSFYLLDQHLSTCDERKYSNVLSKLHLGFTQNLLG